MTHFNVCYVILLLEKSFLAVVLDVLVIVSELMIYHLSVFDTNGYFRYVMVAEMLKDRLQLRSLIGCRYFHLSYSPYLLYFTGMLKN
jgi:hypothetical protein